LKIKNKYLKIKNKYLKMDVTELLNEKDTCDQEETKRERLSAIVAGGGSKQYLGKDLQMSDIDPMTPEQINKLYCRYEARLGASMTKTLGNSFINLYVMAVSKYFNVVNPPKLIQDLEEDPFINHALTSTCCELYYRYGMYLAPFTAILTTTKHINFDKISENITIENDERDNRNGQNEKPEKGICR
jgi:hypothetical protein